LNDIFEDFFESPSLEKTDGTAVAFAPKVDVREADERFQVFVELPGTEEKDIDISLTNDTLTIKGEKKFARDEKTKDRWYSERSFGSFQRNIAVPAEINHDEISATFKNGVLTIDLPKSPAAQNRVRKISVN